MKVIVTGATGFLGGHVIEDLLAHDYQVVALGRNKKRLKEIDGAYNIETLSIDLTDLAKLEQNLPQGDAIIHAAALSTYYGKYELFYDANVVATKNLYQVALSKNYKKFVYVSSPSVYTKNENQYNLKEEEFDLNNRTNNYIRTKIEAEQWLLNNSREKLEVSMIRPRAVFGVGDTTLFPKLIEANDKIGIPLFQKGKGNTMDVTCVENVAYALRLCLQTDNIHKEIFNITNGVPESTKELLQSIFDLWGNKVTFKKMNKATLLFLAKILEISYSFLNIKKEPLITYYTILILACDQTLDISKAQQVLGYNPPFTTTDGIKKYIQHLKEGKIYEN